MRFINASFNHNDQNSVDEELQLKITSLGNESSINPNDYRSATRLLLFQGASAYETGNHAAQSQLHRTRCETQIRCTNSISLDQ